jgi:hypothetical protein
MTELLAVFSGLVVQRFRMRNSGLRKNSFRDSKNLAGRGAIQIRTWVMESEPAQRGARCKMNMDVEYCTFPTCH